MSSYRESVEYTGRAKAMLAAVAINAVLAAIILTGLNVRMVRHAVDHPQTRALVLLSAGRGGRTTVRSSGREGLLAGDRFDAAADLGGGV